MINNIKNIKDPEVMDKLIKFAKVFENDKLYDLKRSKLDCLPNVKRCEIVLNQGRKYSKVDYGSGDVGACGMFMIDNATGEIFGINGYGKVNKKHYYGTLDNFESKFWGNYNISINKNYTRDMQNLLTVAGVVKEMEEPKQVTEVTPEPAEEEKEEVNSLYTVKFVNGKIAVKLENNLLEQFQNMKEKLRSLAHNGFDYDFNNQMFIADDNDFMKNLLIKLGFLQGELKSVRKRDNKDFKIKEKETNKDIIKNNSKNEPDEQKDNIEKTKNVIFVDFNKHSKNKNDSVAPKEKEPIEITINTENHRNEVFDNWKAATSVYNGIINFLQYHNEDDREDIFYITVKQGNKEYYKKFYVDDKTEKIEDLNKFLIKDTISDMRFFRKNKLGKEYIEKINHNYLNKLIEEFNFLSSFADFKNFYN